MTTRRIGQVTGPQRLLDVDRAAYCIHRAREFRKHRIAGGMEDAPTRLGDEIVDDFPIGCETPQRLFLIFRDQP
jgi:hypothetical protein